jgi:phytoene desaturase
MAYSEIAHGVWYPRGGMYRIVEGLMEIAGKAGVECLFETAVERIDVNGASARGVTLADGRCLAADVVIANADLPYVYNTMLPDRDLADRIDRKRFSCSVISFFWAVDKTYPALGPHTLFLADDYRQNFDAITRGTTLPENPSLYVHAPARIDAGMAPAGQDTLIAVVPVGHLRPDNAWDRRDYCAWARRHVLRRLATLGITDLEAHLKFELSWSPADWLGHYNLMKGATHGLSHNLTQLGYMRPPNRHPRYRNLYFVGASTHPGTGIPTVLVSARHVAQRVMDDHA